MSAMGDDDTELPTDELRAAAFNLLQETPSLRATKIDELRSAIFDLAPEHRMVDLSSRNLIRYLRGKKYVIDKALKMTVNYTKFARENPDLVSPLTGKEKRDFLPIFSKGVQILGHKDVEGRVVVLVQPGLFARDLAESNFRSEHPHSLSRFNVWLFDVLSSNIEIQVYG